MSLTAVAILLQQSQHAFLCVNRAASTGIRHLQIYDSQGLIKGQAAALRKQLNFQNIGLYNVEVSRVHQLDKEALQVAEVHCVSRTVGQ